MKWLKKKKKRVYAVVTKDRITPMEAYVTIVFKNKESRNLIFKQEFTTTEHPINNQYFDNAFKETTENPEYKHSVLGLTYGLRKKECTYHINNTTYILNTDTIAEIQITKKELPTIDFYRVTGERVVYD